MSRPQSGRIRSNLGIIHISNQIFKIPFDEPEGTVLFCRPFDEENEELPIDKYVIAVTSSTQTDQVEATVKKLTYNDAGALVLRPESRNKILHGRDLALGADTELGTEVRVSAIVVGFTRQFD